MTTGLVEKGSTKCERYWPAEADGKTALTFGDIRVVTTSVDVEPGCIHTVIKVRVSLRVCVCVFIFHEGILATLSYSGVLQPIRFRAQGVCQCMFCVFRSSSSRVVPRSGDVAAR